MDLYTMQYVLAVAEYRSFSVAAQACFIGQPALSQQITRLEKELGVKLFERTTHGVALTQAGECFVCDARQILQSSQTLRAKMAQFAGLNCGSMTLGTISSLQCIDFGNMLSAFCARYPNICVNIEEQGTYYLLKMLAERRLDAALLNHPQSSMPAGLRFAPLGEDRYSAAVSVHHRLAQRGTVSLQELREEPFIFHQIGQVASELCMEACRNAGFTPHIVCRTANPTMGLYMARGGMGVVFVPSEEFLSRKLDGIVELKLEEPILKRVGICWRADSASPLIQTLVSFSQDWVSKQNLQRRAAEV